jgi:hypothetical protein
VQAQNKAVGAGLSNDKQLVQIVRQLQQMQQQQAPVIPAQLSVSDHIFGELE